MVPGFNVPIKWETTSRDLLPFEFDGIFVILHEQPQLVQLDRFVDLVEHARQLLLRGRADAAADHCIKSFGAGATARRTGRTAGAGAGC